MPRVFSPRCQTCRITFQTWEEAKAHRAAAHGGALYEPLQKVRTRTRRTRRKRQGVRKQKAKRGTGAVTATLGSGNVQCASEALLLAERMAQKW